MEFKQHDIISTSILKRNLQSLNPTMWLEECGVQVISKYFLFLLRFRL